MDTPQGENIYGSYVVSGQHERGVTLELLSPHNELIQRIDREREGTFNAQTVESGEHRACFRNFELEPIIVTFEIYTNQTEAKGQVVDSKHINEMDAQLTGVLGKLAKVRVNQRFEDMRARVHSTVLNILNSKIQWSSLFKMLILGVVGAGQIYVVTSLFRKKGRVSV